MAENSSRNFSIKFLDVPVQYLDDDQTIASAIGQIILGDFCEEFTASLYEWSQKDYERQWRRVIHQILEGTLKTALLTSFVSPAFSDNCWTWPLYREDYTVYVQNHLQWYTQGKQDFSPDRVEQFIRDRRTRDEDGDTISEWSVSVEGLAAFALKF